MTMEQAQALFAAHGCSLTEQQYAQFCRYETELVQYNEKVNLTAITESDAIWHKHFLDSAVILAQIELPQGAALLDVGTGAGFPGMVLAVMRPDLQVTLLDSLQKRVVFLEQLAEALELSQVHCIHGRAEDLGHRPELREQFDVVCARAVAALPMLCEYCLPFVKQGGTFWALKGPGEAAEDSAHAVEVLGGAMQTVLAYHPEDVGERQLIGIQKVSQTSPQYPRKPHRMKQKPL